MTLVSFNNESDLLDRALLMLMEGDISLLLSGTYRSIIPDDIINNQKEERKEKKKRDEKMKR